MADGNQNIQSQQSVEIDPSFDLETDQAKAKAKRLGKRKLLLHGLALSVLAAGGGAATWWTLVGSHYVGTDNAYVGASSAQVTAQTGGPLAAVRFDDTERVRKGDVLAIIDPAEAQIAVARAEADYRRTVQRVRQYDAQAAAAAAQIAARQADLERARTDYGRRQALAATGAVSAEEVTATRTAFQAAQANLAVARESQAAQAALTTPGGVDRHPEVLAAKAALDSARLDLERTVIRAPVDGVVAQRKVQVGQRVQPGQALMTVTPLAQAYVDANFKEGQLGQVRIGQTVKLTSDLYGDKVTYHGRVTGLGGGTGSAFAVIPAQNATGNWIKVVQRVPVRIALDPTELAKRPLRVGLSMNAEIDLRS